MVSATDDLKQVLFGKGGLLVGTKRPKLVVDCSSISDDGSAEVRRAVEKLLIIPDEVWVDGTHVPNVAYPRRAIIKGDALVAAISAASILAKSARDRELVARLAGADGEVPDVGGHGRKCRTLRRLPDRRLALWQPFPTLQRQTRAAWHPSRDSRGRNDPT